MLFADADVFWKQPNVYDVTGVIGFIVGVGSVWLSWRWAKQDIDRRITEAVTQASDAARAEVRRVAHAVMHSGVTDTIRTLELAREACRGKQWVRATDLCYLGRTQLTRTLAQPNADEIRTRLRDVSAILQDCGTVLKKQPKTGTGAIPDATSKSIDDIVLILHSVESQLTGIRLE